MRDKRRAGSQSWHTTFGNWDFCRSSFRTVRGRIFVHYGSSFDYLCVTKAACGRLMVLAEEIVAICLGDAGTEALAEPVTMVRIGVSARILGDRGTASAARGSVATLSAHWIRNDVAPAPAIEGRAIHQHFAVVADVADAEARIGCALPACMHR
jgi:hypothetical protein